MVIVRGAAVVVGGEVVSLIAVPTTVVGEHADSSSPVTNPVVTAVLILRRVLIPPITPNFDVA